MGISILSLVYGTVRATFLPSFLNSQSHKHRVILNPGGDFYIPLQTPCKLVYGSNFFRPDNIQYSFSFSVKLHRIKIVINHLRGAGQFLNQKGGFWIPKS